VAAIRAMSIRQVLFLPRITRMGADRSTAQNTHEIVFFQPSAHPRDPRKILISARNFSDKKTPALRAGVCK
jgi:hypothetical protein